LKTFVKGSIVHILTGDLQKAEDENGNDKRATNKQRFLNMEIIIHPIKTIIKKGRWEKPAALQHYKKTPGTVRLRRIKPGAK
jgi:hypothetical protein